MSKPAYPWYTLFYRRSHLLVLSIIIILVAGVSALTALPRLEDPRIDTRNALVITPYPGASAERVEALVTDVLEDRLREIYEIKEIDSTSRAGISVIALELQDWVDNSTNEQIFSEIRDTLNAATAEFPDGAGTPVFDEKRGATAFTLLLALQPEYPQTTSLAVVTRLAEELADRLRNVSGTELVRIYGDVGEEITVAIDPVKLASTGLTLTQVSQQIRAADPKQPAGTVSTDDHDIRIKVSEPLENLDTIRSVVLATDNGRYLRVADIATVKLGWHTPENAIALVDGERSIFIAARMQNTVRSGLWTEQALKAVDKFNQRFSGTVRAKVTFEQNKYTAARLADLSQNLLLGCAVVMLVIFVFMGFRASWIVGLALPLCGAFTLFSLSFFGEQIHQMSIFGMIIAIGLLIDNAIVITDEIRINLLDPALTRVGAMAKSVTHLFVPLLASTLTTILGFMPIFLLNGNIGDFIGAIAISVVMALVGSLFISLTIIAALAARFLPRDAQQTRWWHSGLQAPGLTAAFKSCLAGWVQRPIVVLSLIVSICVAGFVLAGRLDNVFFPSADRNQFEVYLWTEQGTSIGETYRRTQLVDAAVRDLQAVEQVTWLVGGSAPSVYYNQVMKRDNTPNFANGVITTYSVAQASELIQELQSGLQQQFPDLQVVVRAFGQGPPIAAPVEVDIIGPDLDTLNELGQQVRLIMNSIPGLTQSVSSITFDEPELKVDVKDDIATLSNSTLVNIATQLQVDLAGQTGGSVLQGTEHIPVRVRIRREDRDTFTALAAIPLMIAGAQTAWMPLQAISEFVLMPSLSGITRKNGERMNRIQGYLLPDVPAVDVSAQIQQRLDKELALPEGYRITMAGDADEQQQAMGQLVTYAPVLLVLMLTTLILTFTSVRKAVVIGLVAVMSVGLGMLSLWISGLPVGFNPLLGCAGLIGVAINGSIVVIAAINANEEARQGRTRAIVEETMGCSRHILSTTFTTVGGLVPLLIFSPGSFWPPLAVVLAGGVGFSVILSLVFTPTVIAALNRHRHKNRTYNLT